MRNWKSFFSKEDFPIELGDERAQEVADKANALLIEALNQAEPVYGRGVHGLSWYCNNSVGQLDEENHFKGRIVAIEDISDEEREAFEEERERLGLRRYEPWFDKHQLMHQEGHTAAISDLLVANASKGLTKLPIAELNEGLRGGLRNGEVTYITGDADLTDVLSIFTLTAFQHGHKVLRIVDGAMDYINHDRFPRAIEIFKFFRSSPEVIESELPEFIIETGATFVVIDRLEIEDFFFKENRTAEDFQTVMRAVQNAAKASGAHIVLSRHTLNLKEKLFEEIPLQVVENSQNIILFECSSFDKDKLHIEIKKCTHEINLGRIHSEFRCLKPSEWPKVLTPTKYEEIED